VHQSKIDTHFHSAVLDQIEPNVCHLFEKYVCITAVFFQGESLNHPEMQALPRRHWDAASSRAGDFNTKWVKCPRLQRHHQRGLKR
jgi:hypothetical protein